MRIHNSIARSVTMQQAARACPLRPVAGARRPLVVCGGAATAAAAADAAPPLLRQRRHRSFAAALIHRPPTAVAAATSDTAAAAAAEAEEDFEDMDSYAVSNEMGPAARATLRLLEWPALCEHVAMFASTAVGQRAARALEVPATRAESERLIAETRAVIALEFDHASILDFGGINTGDAEAALRRAEKAGMASGPQLRGLVTLLTGAGKLRAQIQTVARQTGQQQQQQAAADASSSGARSRGARRGSSSSSPLRPLLDAVQNLAPPAALMRDIAAALTDDGDVLDSASEKVRNARAKVRALQSRAASALKAFPGEPSERGGRACIAAPAGTKLAGGVVLGAAAGGGLVYIEPAQLVGLNNELLAARAEAMSAEEGVLWDLSGRLMGVLPEAMACFEAVVWLDLTAAKARCGMWLGGVLPEFVSWRRIFRARAAAVGDADGAEGSFVDYGYDDEGGSSEGAAAEASGEESDGEDEPAVRLRGLSHPLLLVRYLKERERLQRELRRLGEDDGEPIAARRASKRSGGGGGGSGSGGGLRHLSTRKPEGGSGSASSGSSDDDGEDAEAARVRRLRSELRALAPPRPIDVVVEPVTAAVVVTGPNTGGKTAAMKALGLAALMAKAGIPVPAAAPARLPAFSAVLADIGDEQSLTANLSTFSGHLKRISALREEADGRALVLLDELGTGTDPSEGAALGVALLRRLARGGPGGGALTVATTHHSLMTKLKFEDPRFENASVEFDEAKLAPTYKLLWGVPGRSNALNIAARLGLDASVVAAARARLGAAATAADAAIAELEVAQGELEREEAALWAAEQDETRLERAIAGLRRSIAARRDALEELRLARLAEVAAAARAVARAARRERREALRRSTTQPQQRDSELSRRLDEATLDRLAAGPGSVLSAIGEWERATSASSPSASPSSASSAMMFGPADGSGDDGWWVAAWRKLLTEARATSAAAAAAGVALDALPADGPGSGGGDMDAELEALEAAAARRAARAAEREAKRSSALARAVEIDQARAAAWASKDAAAAADDGDDLGLGMDLRALAAAGDDTASAARDRAAAAALTRLEEALCGVDTAAEAAAEAEAAARARAAAEAAEAAAAARAARTAELLESARGARAVAEAAAFEAQLAELEAAAAAAEGVVDAGMERLGAAAAARQLEADLERLAWEEEQWQKRQQQELEAAAMGLDLPPELADLISAVEGGGNGGAAAAAAAAGPAPPPPQQQSAAALAPPTAPPTAAPPADADAALEAEMRRLAQLQDSLRSSGANGGKSGGADDLRAWAAALKGAAPAGGSGGGSGNAAAKRKRRRKPAARNRAEP